MITLQECSLEIDMGHVPLSIGGDLTLESKSRTSTRRGVRLEIPDLSILKAPKDPPGLDLQELSFLVAFDGQHPATRNVVMLSMLPQVNHILWIVYIVFMPRLCLLDLGFMDLFGVLTLLRNGHLIPCPGFPLWDSLFLWASTDHVDGHLPYELRCMLNVLPDILRGCL